MTLPNQSQRGMALIVTLVLMLIMTIVATASMQITTMQERIAGNTRDAVTAFQAAEAAVRKAEDVLEGASVGAFTGSNGRYEICSATDTRTSCQKPAWSDRASSGWVTVSDSIAYVAKQPEFIIERYTSITDPSASLDADTPQSTYEFYRVTARGYGISDKSIAVLQSTYRRN